MKLDMKQTLTIPSTMKNSMLSLAIVLIMMSVSTSALPSKPYLQTLFIDARNGTDSSVCLTSGGSLIACQSLNWALGVGHRMNSTQYILSVGTHYINQAVVTFKDLSHIAFSGSGNSSNETVIHCTNNTAALAFESVANIVISNITFSNCSAIRNSTSKNFHHPEKYETYQFYVALYFYSCKNVSLSHMKVENSPGATGVVMYDTDGAITVTKCNFSNNSVDPNNLDYPGGGGFYVEFTYCIPGDIHCRDSQSTVVSHTSRNTDAVYIFDNCTFMQNNANNPQLGLSAKNSSSFIVPFRADHIAFGRGGGLSIFVKGNATRNSFVISECHFIENSALWGGGLFVEFHDNTSSNVVNVTSCFIIRNECFFTANSGTAGGGMRLGHYVYGNSSNSKDSKGNYISISLCNFKGNAALNGGGLSISPTLQNVPEQLVAIVELIRNHFDGNYARLGAALHIDRFTMILEGHMLTVSVEDNTFNSNSVDYAHYLLDRYGTVVDSYQMGVGAMYVNQVDVVFVHSVWFGSNNGSAIAAIGTGLDFTNCLAFFDTNFGYNGGAIALLGMAYLRIDSNTNMVFTYNIATVSGGAIYNRYIERKNFITNGNCFIRHTDYLLSPDKWGAEFYFSGNYDQGGASMNSIHTTSAFPCTWGGENLIGEKDAFCWSNWTYDGVCTDQVKTDVGSITLNRESNQTEAFPGQQFQLPITILDDLKHSMTYQTLFSVSEKDYQNHSDKSVMYVLQDRVSLNGTVNSSVKLLFDSLGDIAWHVNINVSFIDCPPGFRINGNGTSCECANDYDGNLVHCDSSTSKAFLKSNVWMGIIPGQHGYFIALCPPQFCSSNETTPLPKDPDELNTKICGYYNRAGIICGECKSGFGVAVNSPFYNCINCTDEDITSNIFKYAAAVYIPLIIFFTLIILFNIRLTSGAANAFILYSQLISTTFNLSADGQIPMSPTQVTLHTPFSVPYGIFNLQFFERFIPDLCLGSLNTLDVIALDYVVAVFPLVIILLVVLFVKVKDLLSSRCTNNRFQFLNHPILEAIRQKWKVRSAILPAFAAFLLLSYNKFSITSAYLLGTQTLISDNNQPLNEERLYYYGKYSFSSENYIRLYLPLASVVLATFVAIPPLLLLDFPIRAFEWCISKVDRLWRIYPAGKVQILLDTFQGCYKNKMRCFSGLYFLFRLVINTAYLTTSWLSQYYVQQMACAFMVGLLIICKPYNKEYNIFNTVDILIFLNLSALNAISFYLYSFSLINPNSALPSKPYIVQYCLVYLPLLYMLGYIVWYFIKPYKVQMKCRLIGLKNSVYRKDQTSLPDASNDGDTERIRQNISSLSRIIEISGEAYSEEEALLHRAESVNRYRSHTSTVIGIENQTEGVATIQTNSTDDSGLRSSILSAMNDNYGSNGNTPQSTSQSNSGSRTTHNMQRNSTSS